MRSIMRRIGWLYMQSLKELCIRSRDATFTGFLLPHTYLRSNLEITVISKTSNAFHSFSLCWPFQVNRILISVLALHLPVPGVGGEFLRTLHVASLSSIPRYLYISVYGWQPNLICPNIHVMDGIWLLRDPPSTQGNS